MFQGPESLCCCTITRTQIQPTILPAPVTPVRLTILPRMSHQCANMAATSLAVSPLSPMSGSKSATPTLGRVTFSACFVEVTLSTDAVTTFAYAGETVLVRRVSAFALRLARPRVSTSGLTARPRLMSPPPASIAPIEVSRGEPIESELATRPLVLDWPRPAGGGDDVCSRCVISGAMEAGGAVKGRKNESGNCGSPASIPAREGREVLGGRRRDAHCSLNMFS